MAKATDPGVRSALLSAGGTLNHVSAATNVIQQGDPAEWVYYIVSGKVRITVTSKQGKEGVVGPMLSKGSFIGEIGRCERRALSSLPLSNALRCALAKQLITDGLRFGSEGYLLHKARDAHPMTTLFCPNCRKIGAVFWAKSERAYRGEK